MSTQTDNEVVNLCLLSVMLDFRMFERYVGLLNLPKPLPKEKRGGCDMVWIRGSCRWKWQTGYTSSVGRTFRTG